MTLRDTHERENMIIYFWSKQETNMVENQKGESADVQST